MNLGILRIKGYQTIVETLKSGTNFCIHGTSLKNLKEILDSPDKFGYFHYFGVDAEARELPDREFYERLWASVDDALLCSSKYKIQGDRAIFDGNPCLLLGIEKKLPDGAPPIINPDYPARETVRYVDGQGNPLKTFKIGNGFYCRDFIDLKDLVVGEAGKKVINGKLKDYCRRQNSAMDTALSLIVRRELIMSMIRKINAAVPASPE